MPAEDDKIWQAYATGVKRIKRSSAMKSVIPARAGIQWNVPTAPAENSTGSRINFLSPAHAAEKKIFWDDANGQSVLQKPLDRRKERAMRDGAIEIDARIDLHGMTQVEAHEVLNEFLAKQVKAGRRNLLVVTGKGSRGDGMLRARLPQWLTASPQAARILAARSAAPKHGGAGAFYVLLKKRKDKR